MYASKVNTQNGIVPIGSNLFGTCASSASATTKIVTLADFDVLVEGVTIHVYFTNGNTASAFSLKVGSTNAVSAEGSWDAGEVASFTYHNSRWIQNDQGGGSSTGLKYTIDAPDGTTTNNVVQNDVSGNTATGGYALAEGLRTEASGEASHAEGRDTIASASNAHAEGNDTTASGINSHAEGSHTVASGIHSHARGTYSEASGARATAIGNTTIARGYCQVALGQFNIAQGNAGSVQATDYMIIGGNGSDSNNRSDAFGVRWDGNIHIALFQSAGSIDADLSTAITTLGWDSEVIV